MPAEWRRSSSTVGRGRRHNKRRLYATGLAASGALNVRTLLEPRQHGRLPLRYVHAPVRMPWADYRYVRQAACGHGFSVFSVHTPESAPAHLSPRLYGSGLNTCGQLGRQPTETGQGSRQWLWSAQPIDLPIEGRRSAYHVDDVAAGRAHLLVAVKDHGLFTYGQNNHGQCGRPIIESENYATASISGTHVPLDSAHDDVSVSAVCCGLDHSLLLTNLGGVYAFGLNASGQCGTGNLDIVHKPTKVLGSLADKTAVQIHSCADTNLALDSNGGVHIWGLVEYGQATLLGRNKGVVDLVEPIELPVYEFVDKNEHGSVVKVGASGSSCVLLTSKGAVFVWGWGLLGLGPNVHSTNDTLARVPPKLFGLMEEVDGEAGSKVVDLWAGLMHYAALTNRGELYVWGKNRYGLLGLGHTSDQYFPMRLSVPGRPIGAALGPCHCFLITKPMK